MKDIFERMNNTLKHLETLHKVFADEANFAPQEKMDYDIYKYNEETLTEVLNNLNFSNQLYHEKGRQMILADFIEYIFLGRGYYSLKSKIEKQQFVKAILHFANMLMSYEAMTASDNIRKKFLEKLGEENPEIRSEEYYTELKDFTGKVGLPQRESDASKQLNKYFDSLLPKTAGGLWHELLVYIFLLRNDIGYIVPLVLSQRLISKESHIIPPDFLVITTDKSIYGVEVGTKKEIQSGSFSIQTKIPTATIDTENSRVSDRCPICKRWIPFCDYVVNNYSDFDKVIRSAEIRCLDECNIYSKEEIASGKCPYTKYSRQKAQSLAHARHEYASGLHYHYQCVLERVPKDVKDALVSARDTIALKTHYPYYSGLETLMKG
jgi:hypothetical protein